MNGPVGQCGWPEHSSGSMILARREGLLGLVAIIAGLHVTVFSVVLGPRCVPYLAAAYLTAVAVWGSISVSGWMGRAGVIVGVGLSLAIQQTAYHAWKTELGGVWWPLAQYFALQLLIGGGVRRAIGHALGSGRSLDRRGEIGGPTGVKEGSVV